MLHPLLQSIFCLLSTLNNIHTRVHTYTLYADKQVTKESGISKTSASTSISETVVTAEPVATDVSENATE